MSGPAEAFCAAPLFWYCDVCGLPEPAYAEGADAEGQYEEGDDEPCVHCGDGTARVVTLEGLDRAIRERCALRLEAEAEDYGAEDQRARGALHGCAAILRSGEFLTPGGAQ